MKSWFGLGWLSRLRRLWPGRRLLARYRVAPHHGSGGFRRELWRDVHRKLRRAGLVSNRPSSGTTS